MGTEVTRERWDRLAAGQILVDREATHGSFVNVVRTESGLGRSKRERRALRRKSKLNEHEGITAGSNSFVERKE